MPIHPLLSSFLPHRIAGGIGLLLIGVSVASVTYRSTRPATPFQTSGVAKGPVGISNITRPVSQDNSSGSESEVAYRSFSVTTDKLPPFQVTDLTARLKPNEQFEVITLSQEGSVLGTVIPGRGNSVSPGAKRQAPRTFAARWRAGTLQRMPIPAGAHRVIAGDMNDRGDIAAVSILYRRGKPSYNRVILYNNGSAYQDLGTLDEEYAKPDTENSTRMRGVSENLISLNNRGTLLALVGSKSWFRRSDGAKAAVGEGIAFDLNNDDTAVGFVGTFASGAVMWRNVTTPKKSVVTPLLPTQRTAPISGQSFWRGSAECVNDKGETVVTVQVDSSNGFRRLTRTAYYLLRNGKLQLIAQMRGYQRSRARINDLGDVVGLADTDQQTQTISPILYRGGKMYDLSDVAKDSGWRIIGTVDINNDRQILAYGIHKSDESRMVPLLLTPTVSGP